MIPWFQRLRMFFPFLVFGLLSMTFYLHLLSENPNPVASTGLVGKKAPCTSLAALPGAGLPALNMVHFSGQVVVVNIFSSWCVPCHLEHPFLMDLSRDTRFALVGINYKDQPESALKFLSESGNPYTAIGVDQRGREALEWGAYGVPETFVIGHDGRILWRQAGPLDQENVDRHLFPVIRKALEAKAAHKGEEAIYSSGCFSTR